MQKETVPFVNKNNLVWCREKSGLTINQVYEKAKWSSKTHKIEKWEAGSDFPTIDDLKKLGKIYKKAWTLFVFEQDLKNLDFMVMKDFRGCISDSKGEEKSEIIQFLNEIERRQLFVIEFSNALEIIGNKSFGSLTEVKDVNVVANKIIQNLNLNMEEFRRKKTRLEALNFLQEELGRNNIFVSFSSTNPHKKISLEHMRGVLMRSFLAPIIGINSAEKSVGAKIFTIFHELAHLYTEKVDHDVLIDTINFRDLGKRNTKEGLCDQIAAEILVPRNILVELKGTSFNPEIVKKYCIYLKVNREPFLIRAKEHGLISEQEFNSLKNISVEEQIKKNKKGNPDGGLLHILKNGKSFMRLVNSLYSTGLISYSQALGALNTKSNAFNKYVIR